MKCTICSNESKPIFIAKILRKFDVQYFHCPYCNFLLTEEPFWLKEAYRESINVTDTGILQRNITLSEVTSTILYFFFDRNAKYLDYAGGYGIFVRLMRDIGFDFCWHDLYSNNLLARGFEYKNTDTIHLITSMESFEHFPRPLDEIDKMLAISPNLLFTTELLPNLVPKPCDWWYYGFEHGQHISFYSRKTLQLIAKKYNLELYTNGSNIHLFTQKNISKTLFKFLIKHHKKRWLHNHVRKNINSNTFNDMQYLRNKE
jgi:hypothetical protein